MKTKHFSPGEEVRIKGDKNRYRFVKGNVVRNIATGRCMGVEPSKIRHKRKSIVEILRSIFL